VPSHGKALFYNSMMTMSAKSLDNICLTVDNDGLDHAARVIHAGLQPAQQQSISVQDVKEVLVDVCP
jgi:hypothetical protein